jgi:hypothetical protein
VNQTIREVKSKKKNQNAKSFKKLCPISNLRQIFHSNDTNTVGQCEIYDLTADFMVGIRFELAKPDYTSQTCECGHREKANRNGIQFRCKKCGYTCHADLNGAINIAKAISGLVA